ncbi:hypothetical protein FACS1894172_17570 [Spirochaetia bacterium]|nr:hypothetical protein FACS1894164_04490 [Spirochaetia bacterium]GHU35585.1 hypothetical protein FACS1894172_17570 [Spirochaetia bacterium]
MEELRSTEVLDREILEEARRKAFRILKGAEDSVKQVSTQWDTRIDDALAEARKKHDARVETVRWESSVRLPLDKQRARLKKIESQLDSAVESYINQIPRKKLLTLLETTLKKQLEHCEPINESIIVQVRQLQDPEVTGILKKVIPHGIWKIQSAEPHFVSRFPAIRLDTSAVRIITSIDALVAGVLEDKRAELVGALMGKEIIS